METERYDIVRLYRRNGIRPRVIKRGLTLVEAQAWCARPETSSSTCTWTNNPSGMRRTRAIGAWFDAYDTTRGGRRRSR